MRSSFRLRRPRAIASNHSAGQTECLAQYALLSCGLGNKHVGAAEAVAKQPAFGATRAGKWRQRHTSRVVGKRKDERSRMPSTPVPNEPGFRFSAPLVVDIGIGALHRIPQPGESRMEEAKPAHADIGTV